MTAPANLYTRVMYECFVCDARVDLIKDAVMRFEVMERHERRATMKSVNRALDAPVVAGIWISGAVGKSGPSRLVHTQENGGSNPPCATKPLSGSTR